MKKITPLIFILCLFSLEIFATHFRAGDITYKYISGYTYEVTITLYMDESSMATFQQNTVNIYWGDGDSSEVVRINGPDADGNTLPDGENMGNNINKSIYKSNHTYPGVSNYIIEMLERNRVSSILNIPNSVNAAFELKAELVINNLWNNDSPTYLYSPFEFAAINQLFTYNSQPVENNGDSLSYELIPCFNIPGYTYPAASTSFIINQFSGTVTWNTPMYLGDYNFCIKTNEWRKIGSQYYFAGSTMREIQIEVLSSVTTINNVVNSMDIIVYPNPSQNTINIKIPKLHLKENFKCELLDIRSQLIKSFDIEYENPSLKIEGLPSGLYFFTLKTNGKIIATKKFTVTGGN